MNRRMKLATFRQEMFCGEKALTVDSLTLSALGTDFKLNFDAPLVVAHDEELVIHINNKEAYLEWCKLEPGENV